AFYLFPLLFTGEPALTFDIMLGLMVTQVIAKTLYEIVVLPLTIRIVKYVKRIEGTDIYDDGISYSAFKIKDL
ncbi:MAG: VUT family protein, partial [Bacteroidaceae bacterium]|nr:VUT family protein [Bacteroidaceae bacterium]